MPKLNAPSTLPTIRQEASQLTPVPPALEEALGPPSLLPGENVDAYNALHDHLRRAVHPSDAVEEMWVRDVADLCWEILRLRRFKNKLTESAMSRSLDSVLGVIGVPESARRKLVAAWETRGEKELKSIERILQEGGRDWSAVAAETFQRREKLVIFERVDDLILRSERRRDSILREIERRRETVARRMRDALQEVEEVEEVAEPAEAA